MPRKKSYQWHAAGEANTADAPSRSAKKRQSLALQALGEELTRLSSAELKGLDLSPDLHEALGLYARLSDHEGRRRQMQYIGRLMREMDAEPLRAALDARRAASTADTAHFHHVEQWRERLLSAPDAELESLLQTLPANEEIRRLVQEAREARETQAASAAGGRKTAPHASRALFRALARLLPAAVGKD